MTWTLSEGTTHSNLHHCFQVQAATGCLSVPTIPSSEAGLAAVEASQVALLAVDHGAATVICLLWERLRGRGLILSCLATPWEVGVGSGHLEGVAQLDAAGSLITTNSCLLEP